MPRGVGVAQLRGEGNWGSSRSATTSRSASSLANSFSNSSSSFLLWCLRRVRLPHKFQPVIRGAGCRRAQMTVSACRGVRPRFGAICRICFLAAFDLPDAGAFVLRNSIATCLTPPAMRQTKFQHTGAVDVLQRSRSRGFVFGNLGHVGDLDLTLSVTTSAHNG